jgi:hypothetical protein
MTVLVGGLITDVLAIRRGEEEGRCTYLALSLNAKDKKASNCHTTLYCCLTTKDEKASGCHKTTLYVLKNSQRFLAMAFRQQRRLSYLNILILVLTFGLHLCSAFPLPRLPSAASRILFRQASDSQCGFEGKAELYGLEIRLGVYLQWGLRSSGELLSRPLCTRTSGDQHHLSVGPFYRFGRHLRSGNGAGC